MDLVFNIILQSHGPKDNSIFLFYHYLEYILYTLTLYLQWHRHGFWNLGSGWPIMVEK